jgi:NADH-quinone oxidoreductase subunit A
VGCPFPGSRAWTPAPASQVRERGCRADDLRVQHPEQLTAILLHAMLQAYIPILLFVLVAIGFAIFALIFAWLIRPEKYNRVKLEPYECGIEPKTDARDRYSVRFFLIAMLFVVFDVETVFMFPWAVIMDRLALFGLIEMIVFIFILIVGYFYAWKQGALEWA